MDLYLRPWTIGKAVEFNKRIHRRLPEVEGGLFAVCARIKPTGEVVGCAIVGRHVARVWRFETCILSVTRVAVKEGYPNACSMLYGACSRAAKAMGAMALVTYLHNDEHGTSLKASNWFQDAMTNGGEWSTPSRERAPAVDPLAKQRWWAPWSKIPTEPFPEEAKDEEDELRIYPLFEAFGREMPK